MCNDYEQHIAWAEYRRTMDALDLGIPAEAGASDLPPADDIKVRDLGPAMRAAGNGIELVPMRFGLPPKGRGGPVFNFKSEGRHFDKIGRCLIPATAFFEFTGTKYPKAKHRFSLKGASFLAIAAIWREVGEGEPPAFAMLTTAPGADVAPYHDRQVAVLEPANWAHWIYLTRPEAEMLQPLPAGALKAETVRKGSD